ncbi:Ribonuclease Z, mitochondrial [Amphibalanus amphitrite]|uniref:ribonuclease Z n=1 Tax=Amphibalanus amphitrite TaxID=1232801 RepID=A0A6A4VYE7_AMPAM|nr:Ribonuclease Z, mitochondrial [Amphibalanus amphitrite]
MLQAFRRLPGHRLLATMPKNVDLTERRDARSAKTKKLKSYLFNCGEGTQRLSHERKTRLARLENVFVTCNSWRNVGGVLGALLTLNDIGVPALTLHGPPGLSALYDDTRSFIQLRGMNVQHRSDTDSDFVDVGLKVRAVPLYGSEVRRDPPPASESPPPPSVDYFAYERTGDFLPSLSDLDSSIDMSRLTAVVHFSPPAVMDESIFRTWRGGLPAAVRHIVLNVESHGHGSEAVHRLQYQLNTIDSDLFPLLTGDEVNFGIIPADTGASNGTGNGAKASCQSHPEVYRAELAADETFVARLDEYRRARSTLPPSDDVYPQTVFLGTGSSIPNKKRNTSGILVNLSEKHSILLDCGEGTHGQLVRLQGSEGLISILEARRRALGADHKPCLLMAPAPITNYLNMYHSKMAPLRADFSRNHWLKVQELATEALTDERLLDRSAQL